MALVEYYPIIKASHVGLVMLSGSVFVARGLTLIMGSDLLKARPVRIASMVIDTALLVAALMLLYAVQWQFLKMDWLQVKLTLLVGYIGFGLMTLRFAKTTAMQVLGYTLALMCYVMMFSIALNHHPLGMFKALVQ